MSLSSSVSQSNTSVFDKSIFDKTLHLFALRIPAKQCSKFMKAFDEYTYKRPQTKKIYPVEGDPASRILLFSERVSSFSQLPADLQTLSTEMGGVEDAYDMHMGYDDATSVEAMRQILPSSINELPSSFEQIGHIAHLNLRDDLLPFKHQIGQIILDKTPSLRTVVNKTSSIATEFRTFPMELLAGEENYEVQIKESGAQFKFKFDEVYWNSRLQTEHKRVIDIIKYEECNSKASAPANGSCTKSDAIDVDAPAVKKLKPSAHSPLPSVTTSASTTVSSRRVVADMMAGVGPFAIPLAMEGVHVHANDLNPQSYKALLTNEKLNRLSKKNFSPANMCGRDFIMTLDKQNIVYTDVLMNLPQNATDFLDVFIGTGVRRGVCAEDMKATLPRIHVYGFSTSETPLEDMAERAAGVLKCNVSVLGTIGNAASMSIRAQAGWSGCLAHLVRDVAPKKYMICLSFLLPLEVAMRAPERVM